MSASGSGRLARRPTRAGAYIIRAAESPQSRIRGRLGPRLPLVVTDADRDLARALLAYKRKDDS